MLSDTIFKFLYLDLDFDLFDNSFLFISVSEYISLLIFLSSLFCFNPRRDWILGVHSFYLFADGRKPSASICLLFPV